MDGLLIFVCLKLLCARDKKALFSASTLPWRAYALSEVAPLPGQCVCVCGSLGLIRPYGSQQTVNNYYRHVLYPCTTPKKHEARADMEE